MPVSVKL